MSNSTPRCADCVFYDDGVCDRVNWDDDDYPHNNSKGAGIKVVCSDDQGLYVSLRVDPDFGCVKFTEANGDDDE